VKPIPTVAENEPAWNLPWSNCTSNDVLPTPLSPTRIVYKYKSIAHYTWNRFANPRTHLFAMTGTKLPIKHK